MENKNIFRKIDSKLLATLGLICTGVGIFANLVGGSITDEQNSRTIEKMIDEKIAERLNKG